MAVVMVVSMFPSQATARVAGDWYQTGQPIIYPGMMSNGDGQDAAGLFGFGGNQAATSEAGAAASGSAASGSGEAGAGQFQIAASPAFSAVQNAGSLISVPSDSSYEPASIQTVKVQYEPSASDQAGDISIDIPSADENEQQGGASSGSNSSAGSSGSHISDYIAIGTTGGHYATRNGSTQYYLTSGDQMTLTISNAPEGAKVYYTTSSAAIQAYSAVESFDFTKGAEGWAEYAGPVSVGWEYGDYTNVAAVMVDKDGKEVANSFASTSLWNLELANRDIGLYGGITNYNIRMHEDFNLAGADATNITPVFYVSVGVNEEPADPAPGAAQFTLQEGEPGYISDMLKMYTGNNTVFYKGICVYTAADGSPIWASGVLAGADQVTIEPSVSFTSTPGGTGTQYYPGTVGVNTLYNGSYTDVYYAVGDAGSATSLDGWTPLGEGAEIEAAGHTGDIAFHAILVDPATGAICQQGGSNRVWSTTLVRAGKTAISTSSGPNWLAEGDNVSLSTSCIPAGYSAEVFYTTDGSDPADGGERYTGSMNLELAKGDTVTIKAVSVLTNGVNTITGETASATFRVMAKSPVISVADGVVTITPSEGDAYYTTDLTDPATSPSSAKFTDSFEVGDLSKIITAASTADGVSFTAPSQLLVRGSGVALGTLVPGAPSGAYSFAIGKAGTYNNGEHVYQDFVFTLDEPATVSFNASVATLRGDGTGYTFQLLNPFGEVAGSLVESFEDGAAQHQFAQDSGAALPAGTYILRVAPATDAASAAFQVTVSGITATAGEAADSAHMQTAGADDPVITVDGTTVTISGGPAGADIYFTDTGYFNNGARYTAPFAIDGFNKYITAWTDSPFTMSNRFVRGSTVDLGTMTSPSVLGGVYTNFAFKGSNPQEFSFTLTSPMTLTFNATNVNASSSYSIGVYSGSTRVATAQATGNGSAYAIYSGSDIRYLPAGTYTLRFSTSYNTECVFSLSNIAFAASDRVVFQGAYSEYSNPALFELSREDFEYNAFDVYLSAEDEDVTRVYYTTDGSEPTTGSAYVEPGGRVASVTAESPAIRVNARTYKSGVLGATYQGKFGLVDAPEAYGIDENGVRTKVGYDVIYDKTGKLKLSTFDYSGVFGNDVTTEYYYTVVLGDEADLVRPYAYSSSTYKTEPIETAIRYVGPVTLDELFPGETYASSNRIRIATAVALTYKNNTRWDYAFYNDIYAMPAMPVFADDGSTVTITSASGSKAAIYYSDDPSRLYFYSPSGMTAYSPIAIDRNLVLRAVAVWANADASSLNNSCDGISYDGTPHYYFVSDNPSTTISNHLATTGDIWDNDNSHATKNDFYPIVQRGSTNSTNKTQSYTVEVPTGFTYQLKGARILSDLSTCGAYIKLEKYNGSSWVEQSAEWYVLPTWSENDYAPALTVGTWRLTFIPVSSAEAGQTAVGTFGLSWVANEHNFTYEPLSGLTVTTNADEDVVVNLSGLTLSTTARDEIYTYLTSVKCLSVDKIGGAADEGAAKTIIANYFANKSNWSKASVNRREADGGSFYSYNWKDASSDTWKYVDSSANLSPDVAYVYRARVTLNYGSSSDNAYWPYYLKDTAWLMTSATKPLFTLPTDSTAPSITAISHSLPGGLAEGSNISEVSTIFATITDDQRVESVELQYRLSTDNDDAYKRVGYVKTPSYRQGVKSYNATWSMQDAELTVGSTYLFRIVATDAAGNPTTLPLFPDGLTAANKPTPSAYTVTPTSSSVTITWTPEADYYYTFYFYNGDKQIERIYVDEGTSSSSYVYWSGSATGEISKRVYIDSKYESFTIKMVQEAKGDYQGSLNDSYTKNCSTAIDDEPPVITYLNYYCDYPYAAHIYATAYVQDDGFVSSVTFTISAQNNDTGEYTPVLTGEERIGSPAFHGAWINGYYSRSLSVTHYFDATGLDAGTVYYISAVATDSKGNTSGPYPSGSDSPVSFTVNAPTYPFMGGLAVTSGESEDRMMLSLDPEFSLEAKAEMLAYLANSYSSVTEAMLKDFLGKIANYTTVMWTRVTADSVDSSTNITDYVVDGVFTIQFETGKAPLSGNMLDCLVPDKYHTFRATLVAKDGLEEWQNSLLNQGWFTTAVSASQRLKADSGAPTISEINNPAGSLFIDNATVLSVDVSDAQLLEQVFWTFSVDGYETTVAPTYKAISVDGKVSAVNASIAVSDLQVYDESLPWYNQYRSLENGEEVTFTVYAIDAKGKRSVVRTATYTYLRIDPPSSVSATPGNAQATVSWSKVGAPSGVPEYGYRVYAYKSGDSFFSETDVAAGQTSAVIPLDATKYSGQYRFTVCVLTSTGGLGDMSSATDWITPSADITPPTVWFDEEELIDDQKMTHGPITNWLLVKGWAQDNNYINTITITVKDASGNVYATYTQECYRSNIGYEEPIWCPFDVLDLGQYAGQYAATANGKRYIPYGSYTIVATVTDVEGNVGTKEYAITIDNDAPDLAQATLTGSPYVKVVDGDEVVVANVTWTLPANMEALEKLSVRARSFWSLADAESFAASPDASAYYSSELSTDPSARSAEILSSNGYWYVFTMQATDLAGNESAIKSSGIVFIGESGSNPTVKLGDAEVTADNQVKFGDAITVAYHTEHAGAGVAARLYRIHNNSSYYLTSAQFNAAGTVQFSYTIPTDNATWAGAQQFRVVYQGYFDSSFHSADVTTPAIGLTLSVPSISAVGEIGKVSVTWGAAPNAQGYCVYRSTSADSIAVIGNRIGTTTSRSFTDTRGVAGTSYYYAVVAYAENNGTVVTSQPVVSAAVAKTKDETPPSLKSVSPGSSTHLSDSQEFTVVATDNVGVTDLAVYWRNYDTPSAAFTKLGTYALTNGMATVATTAIELPEGSSQNVFLRFMVLDADGNESNWIDNAYAIGGAPAAPASIQAVAGEREITIGWQPVPRLDVTGYRIYRDTGESTTVKKVADVSATTDLYTDTGLDRVTYRYWVRALYVSGEETLEGAPSAYASALPAEQSTPPTVIYLDPLRNSSFNGNLELTMVASDKVAVNRFIVQYAYLGESQAVDLESDSITWLDPDIDGVTGVVTDIVKISTVDESLLAGLGHSAFQGTLTLPLERLYKGVNENLELSQSVWFAIKVVAENNGGAEHPSAPYYAKYQYDSQAPAAPSNLAVENPMSGGALTITFTKSSDTYYTEILRSTSSDSTTAVKVGETASNSFADSGLTDETTYYYWAQALDKAKNVSALSNGASGKPTTAFTVGITSIVADKSVPVAGQPLAVTVTFRNDGPAKASGTIVLTANDAAIADGTWAFANLAMGAHAHTFACTVPDAATLTFKAAIGSVELTGDVLTVNHAPVPGFTYTDTLESGVDITFTASATDADGDEAGKVTYVWNLGDGTTRNGDTITYRYLTPGVYTVTLTATDPRGATGAISQGITISDKRPDLQVGSIVVYRKGVVDSDYSPVDTSTNPILENDSVLVEATITNNSESANTGGTARGPVPVGTSFLVGFYLNGVYQGYQAVTGGIALDGSATVSFTYTAAAGAQLIKVVANDLLDNLKETNKQNNTLAVSRSASQIAFADIEVTNGTWKNLHDVNDAIQSPSFTSQQDVTYRATVANRGTREAIAFKVSLYVDGELAATDAISLGAGASTTVDFGVTPTNGAHTVTIAADDPTLVELDTTNNATTFTTGAFSVVPATIVTALAVEGAASTLDQGNSVTLTATLTADCDIADDVDVRFYVDETLIKTITVPGGTLREGEAYSQSLTAKWVAQDGTHVFRVVTDAECAVLVEPSVAVSDPYAISVTKPDLWLSDVTWAPTDTIQWGNSASFMARVSNRSEATLYQTYGLALWAAPVIEGVAGEYSKVSSRTYQGIGGHHTSVQILDWTPSASGPWKVLLVLTPGADAVFDTTYYDELDWNNVAAYAYQYDFTVSDGLILIVNPSKKGEMNDFGANMFLKSSSSIAVTATMALASKPDVLLTSTSVGSAHVTMKLEWVGTLKEGQTAPSVRSQTLSDAGTGKFSGNLLLGNDIITGAYLLTYEAYTSGFSTTYSTNVVIVDDIVGTVTANAQTYVAGEMVTISGSASSGGEAYANSTIVLDMTLYPHYGKQQPTGTSVSGDAGEDNQDWWRGEKVAFLTTDSLGNFTYSFKASSGDAGLWAIKAYALEKMFGSGITGSSITIYGMEAKPATTTITAAKGTNFTATVNLYNSAWDGNYGDLSGVSAVLLNGNAYAGIVATLDQGAVRSSLEASGSFPVVLNISTTEDCVDTAEYEIQFSSTQGATATAIVKLALRPGVPQIYADQKTVVVASNPGTTVTKTITVTNKGIATMRDIRTESGSLSFIRASAPSKTSLAPGEALTFDVVFAATATQALGTYQDTIRVTNGVVTLSIPVGIQLTGLDYGTVRFSVVSDLSSATKRDAVKNATITLYGQDPYTQYVNGTESTYYINSTIRTDTNGFADTSQLPVGIYDYTIAADHMQTYTGTVQVLPLTEANLEEVTMTTLPVEISWTVTETTITDEYEIKLTIDMGVTIPTPQIGSTVPWFTIGKEMQGAAILNTYITNNSLIDVIDVVAAIETNLSGFSIVGGNYIGTIPAMSSVPVQILVQPGSYALPAKSAAGSSSNYAKLLVKGSYVSYDPDTLLPVYPVEDTKVYVPIYNAGKAKVDVSYSFGEAEGGEFSLDMPEGVDFDEMDYFLFKNETGGRMPEQKGTSGGGVYEVVKLELSQTASLERQAFDAELTIKNNYPEYALDSLTVEVLLQDKETSEYVSDNVYIIQSAGAGITSIAAGRQYDGRWKIIPGVGLGGATGKEYAVSARITYVVNGKLVTTSTDAIDIMVKPLPQLTLDYYLPHTIYPNQTFRIGVSATNSGTGIAQNVILDSSQLEVVSNTSGLLGTWEITGSSFGSAYDARTFKLTLGDIPGVNNHLASDGSDLPNSVWGYYTVLWSVPELSESYLNGVFGTINNFTADITHVPYEGVELDPLIIAANTHIVARDEVAIVDETTSATESMSVIVGSNALPQFIYNADTNVRVEVYVPENLSGTKASDTEYTFMAPISAVAQSDANKDLRYQVLMIGESADFAGQNIAYVYRYDNASYEGTPTVLSYGNYWKDTYTIDGIDHDLLYVVDQLTRDGSGNILPAYYKVLYGSSLQVTNLIGSQIVYLSTGEGAERSAVFYTTGRNHDENDITDLGLQATVYNPGRNPETATVYLFRASVRNGVVGAFTRIASQSATVVAGSKQLVYYYIDLEQNSEMPGGTYVFRAAFADDADAYQAQAYVTINSQPIANAGVDFDVFVNKPAVFDGSRSYDPDGYIASYAWDFGDGTTGWGIAPTHTYLASGTYIATLYVTDSNGTENAMDLTDYNEALRPTTSYAIHDVMVTVHDNRPDLIIVPDTLASQLYAGVEAFVSHGGGEFAAVSADNPVAKDDKIRIVARIMNDNPAYEVPTMFLVGLYRDNEYLGFQQASTYKVVYTNAKNEEVTTDFAIVTFEATATDSLSHLYTVRANDISYSFDEADLFNNQRTVKVIGASGTTEFPDVYISNLKVNGVTIPQSGIVSDDDIVSKDAITMGSNETIPVVVTVQNIGTDASGEFAVTATVNGSWAASATIENLAVGQSATVTLNVKPEEGTTQRITVTADGPYPRTLDSDRSNNTWEYTTGVVTVNRPDITLGDATITERGRDALVSVVVANEGEGDALKPFKVAFYADHRYLGAAVVNSLAAGATTTATFTWANHGAATEFELIADSESNIDEASEYNNQKTVKADEDGGLVLSAPTMPVISVLNVATAPVSGTAKFGSAMTTTVTVANTGDGDCTGPFAVALFAQGKFLEEKRVERVLTTGRSAELTFTWTADIMPTGSDFVVSALADSAFNVQMSTRDFVRFDETISVADGIAATFASSTYNLTQNAGNEVALQVRKSSDGQYAGDATVTVKVLDGDEVKLSETAVFNSSTARYVATFDLSTLAMNASYTLRADATLGGLADDATATMMVYPALSIAVNADKPVCKTGETVHVSGTTEGAENGATVTITLTGHKVWTFTTTVLDNAFAYDLVLPATAGGAMTLAAAISNGAAGKRASTAMYVSGVYYDGPADLAVVVGKTAALSGSIENIGYTDLTAGELTAIVTGTGAATLPTVKFMTGGHVYTLDKIEGVALTALLNAVSVNGAMPDYESLDFSMQVDATGCAPGDYTVTLQFTASTTEGAYTYAKAIAVTVEEAKPEMAIANLDPLAAADDLFAIVSVSPDEVKSSSFRVVNLGTGDLEGLRFTLTNDADGTVVPWTTLVVTGGTPSSDYTTTTLKPYYDGYTIGTVEGAAIATLVFTPLENTAAATYHMTLIVSAADVPTVRIPITGVSNFNWG